MRRPNNKLWMPILTIPVILLLATVTHARFSLFKPRTYPYDEVHFIDVGEELVYDYRATIDTSSNELGYWLYLYGKLVLQSTEPYVTLVQFVNVSGTFKEIGSMGKPFKIKHDKQNKVIEIVLSQNDTSANFKRGIASMFQFKVIPDEIERINKDTYGKSEEDSIYGKCTVSYERLGYPPGGLTTNIDLDTCDTPIDGTHKRVYKFTSQDLNLRIGNLESVTELWVESISGKVKINQKLEYLKDEDKDIKNYKIEVEQPEIVEKSLKWVDPGMKCRNISSGEELFESFEDTQMNSIESSMESILHYMNRSHVFVENSTSNNSPNLESSQSVHQTLLKLEQLPLDVLEMYYIHLWSNKENHFEAAKLEAFVQLLPQIGTPASALLIRNIIDKGFLTTRSVELLRGISLNLKCVNEDLLTQLERFMELGEPDSELRISWTLAFAALVNKTGDEEIAKKYNEIFNTTLYGNSSRETKRLMIQSLGNVDSGGKYLREFIFSSNDSEFQIMGLWAMKPSLIQNPKLLIRVCLPLIQNSRLSTTVRLTAYSIYIQTTTPTLNWFLKLHNYLKDEGNLYIMNFHYNTLQTYSRIPKFQEIGKTILSQTKPPAEVLPIQGIYNFEYFGFEIRLVSINTKNESIVEVAIYKDNQELGSGIITVDRSEFSQSLFDLIIRGVPFHRLLQLWLKDSVLILLRQQGTTTTILTNNSLALNLTSESFTQGFPILSIPYRSECILPNDLGMPVKVFENLVVGVQALNWTFQNNSLSFKLNLNGAKTTGVEALLPVFDRWQGVQEVKTVSGSFPVNVSLNVFGNDGWFSWNKWGKEVIGLMVHSKKERYSNDNTLDRWESNYRRDDPETTAKFVEYHNSELGHKLEITQFGCDVFPSSRFSHLPQNLFEAFKTQEYIFSTPDIKNCGVSIRLLPQIDHLELHAGLTPQNDPNSYEKESYGAYTKLFLKNEKNESIASSEAQWSMDLLRPEHLLHLSVSGVKTGEEALNGHLDFKIRYDKAFLDANVSLGLGESIDNYGVIKVGVKSLLSDEQEWVNESGLGYPKCKRDFISVDCISDATQFRKLQVNYEVLGNRIPIIQEILDQLLFFGFANADYVQKGLSRKDMDYLRDSDKTQLDLVLSLIPNHWDLVTQAGDREIKFQGMPVDDSYFKYLEILRLNYLDFQSFRFYSSYGPVACLIGENKIVNSDMVLGEWIVSENWNVYWDNDSGEEESRNIVELKKENGKMSIRLHLGLTGLEITKHNDKDSQEFLINRLYKHYDEVHEIPYQGKYFNINTPIKIIVIPESKLLVLKYKFDFQLAFDGKSVRLEFPLYHEGNHKGFGKCLEKYTPPPPPRKKEWWE